MSIINAAITAVGGYLPEDKITNADLEKMVDTNNEWIMTRVGIRERRILKDPTKGASFLGIEAVKDLTNGLGADVVSVEPIAQDNPLLASPNTLLTPHIAWATRTARQNITRIIAENIAGWMAGQPKSVVNKAYLNG